MLAPLVVLFALVGALLARRYRQFRHPKARLHIERRLGRPRQERLLRLRSGTTRTLALLAAVGFIRLDGMKRDGVGRDTAQFVNVIDHGARADGTDDTTAIQTAIDGITTRGTIYIPPEVGGLGYAGLSFGSKTIHIVDARGGILRLTTNGIDVDGKTDARYFNFSTTSGTAVSTVGVKDPIYHRPALSRTVAGAAAGATYSVRITYTNASGETLPSPQAALNVEANEQLVVASPPASLNATGWNVYISNTAGSETKQNGGTPNTIGVDYTLTGALVAGSAVPSSNTTGTTTITPANPAFFSAMVPETSHVASTPGIGAFHPVLVDEGTANEEVVIVTAVTSTTFTAAFTKTHSAGFSVKSATGGIAEAVLSQPLTTTGRGGTVILPPGSTTIKAPIPIRTGVNLEGTGGPTQGGDSGGVIARCRIAYAGTSEHEGALFAVSSISTEGTQSLALRNFTVYSNTHVLRMPGCIGGSGSLVIEGVHWTAGSGGQTDRSCISGGYGAVYLSVRSSYFSGGPTIKIVGSLQINTVIERTRIIQSNGSGVFASKGIVMVYNGGGSGSIEGGGELVLRDVVFELGNNANIDLTDCNNIMVDNCGVADWAPTAGAHSVILTNTLAASTNYTFRKVTWPNQAGAGPTVRLAVSGSGNMRHCGFFDCTFNSQAAPLQWSGAGMLGPLTFMDCKLGNVGTITGGTPTGGVRRQNCSVGNFLEDLYAVGVTLGNGVSTKSVTIVSADANYGVSVAFSYNAGAYWITNKTDAGFDINWANATPDANQTLDYTIFR